MPTERAEDLWVDEMDGPERLERAKKRRAEQLKRWERRENAAGSEAVETKRRRKDGKILKFEPNVVILEAAARNDLEEVARLLDSGASPDLANEDGLTALHQSCIDGCDDMVKYLVEHKANVNACDKESWTPLHAAAACGHMSIIRYLLDNGANILALNLDGNFPVDVAEDNEKVETFLEQQMAKLGYDEAAIEELRLNQGRQLLNDLKDSVKKERSLDVQDENGATAFHVAAANGWTNVIDYLLENEADFEIRDNDGWQPIHAAAAWGHDTILEVLVASGADLDSRTNDSQTPIDLTEEDEIIELIEDLKTKEVKYPRKGKGVRRRRSNTSNSSIKRSSIHEKNELSHADTKAERAALFIQLQNAENLELHSHDELASSPQPLETHVAETTSNSSREEANSSGYVSEGSTDAKAEEKLETNRPKEVSKPEKTQERPKDKLDIGDYIIEGDKKVMREKESTKNDEQKPSPAATKIKQSPVPKPPRMITTSSSKLEPNAYINLEIEPSESTDARTPANTTASKPASVAASVPAKELLEETKRNSKSENLRQSEDKSPKRNELNRSQEKVKTGAEEVSEKRTTQSLPRLASSDKRRAPEPPDSSQTASTLPVAKKSSATEDKKASKSSKRSSESSNKKSCIIL